jgi:anaerobic dimethyl sulfoxide reductase subunit A
MWRSILSGKYIYTGNTYAGQYNEPEERDIDIHVIVSEQHNLLQSQPNINEGIEAFRKVDFVCAQAYTMKTDTKYADIVLPICTRWEVLRDNWYATQADRENTFCHRKILDPLYESKPDYEVAERLAERLGLNFKEIVPFEEKQLWFNALNSGTVLQPDGSATPLCTITQEDLDRYGVQGTIQEGEIDLEKFLDDGVYRVRRSANDAFVDIAYKAFRDDPEKNPLSTVSGKMEIYCQVKGDLFARINGTREDYVVVSPLPIYLEQREGYTDSFIDWENRTRGPYPFQMTHVHYLRRAHTDYDNLPWLREAMINPVFISKEDADQKGINTGDVILVHNDRGKFIRPASVSRCIMPGVIVVPHGAGVSIDEESGIDMAGADNILTSSNNATSTALNGWNTVLVDFEKYTGDIKLLPDCDWPLNIPIAG